MFRHWRNRKASNEAAAWWARMAEPGSSEEVAAFETWLARDPANARHYAEMDAIMTASAAASRNVGTVSPAGPGLLRPALAFGLAGLTMLSAAMLWQGSAEPAFATVANSGSAVRGVRLEDGTRVWLDLGARIGVRFSDDRREIVVREGRVRVFPSADARPLEVRSDAARVTPGLTRTDVSVTAAGTIIGALNGSLAILNASGADDAGPLRLDAGRALNLGSGGVRSVSLDGTWIAGRLRFAETPLRDILAQANRLGDPDIVAPDSEIAGLRVSGVFDLRETRRLARKLGATLDLRVEEREGQLVLRR